MNEPFTTDRTSLFVMNCEYPTWMFCTGLRDIVCNRTERAKVCGNCKSIMEVRRPTCKQCGAPSGNAIDANCSIGKTTAVLYGILPKSCALIDLRNGDTIHVVFRCGRLDLYCPEEVFAVLSNIVITRTSIPYMAAANINNERVVEIVVEVECDFALVGKCGESQQ